MRKFLNTLYVLNKDAYLSLEGGEHRPALQQG